MSEVAPIMEHNKTERTSPKWSENWSLEDSIYQAPEPTRFKELTEGIPKGDLPSVAKAAIRYAFERCGILLTPEQVSEPLLGLHAGNDLKDLEIIDNFIAYTEMADGIWQKIEEADDLVSQYSPSQIRIELPQSLPDANELPIMKILQVMNKSAEEGFKRFGNISKSHSAAIIRVLYAWENGLEEKLPEPKILNEVE
jgi:hypothetical protein